ncbi:anthrax toxin lethal factor-related metalloendopeptidase [Bacillus sp. S/N-304-OC-R1]|uniref:anthrax toxin lethal factor-related metalloendopeptidase n=1 Tax=Bacillus sp. S/N-304-OC-R1 TaxID=2758034 RepID=UPI001C8DA062|nr:toxin [Bacillus sp. S/N-304-OC-R1]MBY0122705.1 toxin [Bacillus sp. S/N-304-OC-R1]
MKRIVAMAVIMIGFLALINSSQAAMGGIQLKDYPQKSLLRHSLVLQSANPIDDIIILPAEPFDEVQAAGIINRIDHLPHSLLEKIDSNDIKIKLFTGKLTDNPSAHYLTGIIPRGYKSKTTWDNVPGIGGSKTVLVKIGYSEKGKGHGSVNLELHELAHSIDKYVYNGIRYNQQFLSDWKIECPKLFPNQDYFLNYPEEYFAETFAMFYLNNETNTLLKKNAPATFNFIKKLN